jgi:hypothetical protein
LCVFILAVSYEDPSEQRLECRGVGDVRCIEILKKRGQVREQLIEDLRVSERKFQVDGTA